MIMDKQVIGAGGMIEAVNYSGIKISGIVTQTAIEQITLTTGSSDLVIYEGFWVPSISVTSVPDSLFSNNDNFNIYPNPISTSAGIYYYLSNTSLVSIISFDILGQPVSIIYNGIRESGIGVFVWDASDFHNGTYIISIEVKSLTTNGVYSSKLDNYYKKVIILK
jgi:hypothetical protein